MIDEIVCAGRTAVVTGAASGIGLSAVRRFVAAGMNVCLADRNENALADAVAGVCALPGVEPGRVLALPTDVADLAAVQALKEAACRRFGEVALLMNNAAVGDRGGPWSDTEAWRRVLGINLWGVLQGLQVFVEEMIHQGTPCAIINVGSKQGITTPPGNAAYNVAKAAVKVLTEQLAHELRQRPGCRVSAHLLVPGFTFTGMTAHAGPDKPAGAWHADQVIECLMQGLAANDFYILCPDNQATPDMDRRRMQWAADDLIKGRPALSRWHADFKEEFDSFMERA